MADARPATAKPTKRTGSNGKNGGDLGFGATLWQAADEMRGNLDSVEYEHVVLGLIFLKYISDAFEERREALTDETDADPEDRDGLGSTVATTGNSGAITSPSRYGT